MWHRRITLVCVLTLTCIYGSSADKDDGQIFSSALSMSKLFGAERKSVELLRKYIQSQREVIGTLKDIRKMIQAEDIGKRPDVENPIAAVELIHRFVSKWKMVYSNVFNGTDQAYYSKTLNKAVKKLKPKSRDLHGSYRSLFRLQNVYGLKPGEIAAGKIQGRISQPLDQGDCYFMARTALDGNNVSQALRWIRVATDRTDSEREYDQKNRDVEDLENVFSELDDFATVHIENYLTHILETLKGYALVKRAMASARKFFGKDAKLDMDIRIEMNEKLPMDLAAVRNVVRAATAGLKEAINDAWKYEALDLSDICQGKSPVATTQPGFRCKYRTPNLPYNVWKEEILTLDPVIVQVYEFITEKEIRHLQEISKGEFKKATTGRKDYQERVQSVSWHADGNSTTIRQLSARASVVTGLDCMDWAENWQVGEYGLGGRYGVHHDFHPERFNHVEVLGRLMGDRIATFMLYLNDVDAGGFTVFPLLGAFVKPVKGSAVLWYNLMDNGEQDHRTLHSACPVLIGHKWVANKWIHTYGNEFNRPCPPK